MKKTFATRKDYIGIIVLGKKFMRTNARFPVHVKFLSMGWVLVVTNAIQGFLRMMFVIKPMPLQISAHQ